MKMMMTLVELIKLPVFPLAEELPFIFGEEEKELAQDLEVNGQKQPIVLWNNPAGQSTLLDGRNRLKALQGTILTEAWIEYFDGDESDAADQVYSLNIPRRHLNVGQKATFALAYLPYEEQKAKKRQLAALEQGNVTKHSGVSIEPSTAQSNKQREAQSRDVVARKVGIHGQRISEAKKLSLDAPDLFKEVKTGEKELTTAYKELRKRTDWDQSKIDFLRSFPEAWAGYQSDELSRIEAYKLAQQLDSQAKEERKKTISHTILLVESFVDIVDRRTEDINNSIGSNIKTVEEIVIVFRHITAIQNYLAVTENVLGLRREEIEKK